MRFLQAFSVFCIVAHGASASQAWGRSGDWEILVNAENGNGCFARRIFEDQVEVQIGAVPVRSGGYFAIYNPAWDDLDAGAFGVIEFDFGDALFAGEAMVETQGDVPGAYAFFDNPAFLDEFVKRAAVTVSEVGGKRFELSLTGTKKAVDAVLACQEQQEPVPHHEG